MMHDLLDNRLLDGNLEQVPYHQLANWITICRKELDEKNDTTHIDFFKQAKIKLEQEQNKRIAGFLKR